MYTLYETERLYLEVITPTEANAKKVLEFYKKNKDVFEPYELDRHPNFYTVGYQLALLQCEHNMFESGETVRFWVFRKEASADIIGTVCFHDIKKSYYKCCDIGYKLDKRHWHHGYAGEAIIGTIGVMESEFDVHRVTAYVMPENTNSLKLLDSLGFIDEGLQRDFIFMHGKWQDHERLAYILS